MLHVLAVHDQSAARVGFARHAPPELRCARACLSTVSQHSAPWAAIGTINHGVDEFLPFVPAFLLLAFGDCSYSTGRGVTSLPHPWGVRAIDIRDEFRSALYCAMASAHFVHSVSRPPAGDGLCPFQGGSLSCIRRFPCCIHCCRVRVEEEASDGCDDSHC